MSAPRLRNVLRLSYAEWERNMLAGTLDQRRVEHAAFLAKLQPLWDKAWDGAVKDFENLILFGTTHPDPRAFTGLVTRIPREP